MKKSDFPVRVTKKGKTRGRPSKSELLMSQMLSHKYKENIPAIEELVFRQMAHGQSEHYINEEGNIVVV